MKIAGFQKFSLIDYPGGVSGVVFTQGCNFRCPYCHNPELVDPRRFVGSIPAEDILGFLEDRRGKLDAVTITGGEPTLQGDLPVFIKEIKDMGFLVKIDTNGSMPTMLARLLAGGLVDYVAMDLKGPLERYPTLVGAAVNRRDLEESIALLGDAGLPHEYRTTLEASLLTVGRYTVERIPAALDISCSASFLPNSSILGWERMIVFPKRRSPVSRSCWKKGFPAWWSDDMMDSWKPSLPILPRNT